MSKVKGIDKIMKAQVRFWDEIQDLMDEYGPIDIRVSYLPLPFDYFGNVGRKEYLLKISPRNPKYFWFAFEATAINLQEAIMFFLEEIRKTDFSKYWVK